MLLLNFFLLINLCYDHVLVPCCAVLFVVSSQISIYCSPAKSQIVVIIHFFRNFLFSQFSLQVIYRGKCMDARMKVVTSVLCDISF